MTAAVSSKTWTDDELLALPDAKHWELWDGALRTMSPSGALHSAVSLAIAAEIKWFVRQHRLGMAFDSACGFRLNPDYCFAADAAFVGKSRLAQVEKLDGFIPFAPDLAVEVLSPSNTLRELESKIALFFQYGCRLAWMIHPQRRTVREYRSGDTYRTLTVKASLLGDPVLPGFKLAIPDLFDEGI